MILNILICSIIGYGFGCISTGYVVGKANHIDIRNSGSGNAGTTNALRVLGVKAALLTFLGDAIKAILPIILIRLVFNDLEPSWEVLALYLGLGVVVGHNYPFWLKFKGGKGIAATAGVIVAIADWRITIVGLILFIAIVGISRYVSLGSLMVAWLIPINTIIFYSADTYFIHMLILSIIFTALAYFRHISNIKKLLSRTEHKIGEKTQ